MDDFPCTLNKDASWVWKNRPFDAFIICIASKVIGLLIWLARQVVERFASG